MTAPSAQVTTLLTQFGLTTAAEELVPRLTQAGHPEAMPVLLEVPRGRSRGSPPAPRRSLCVAPPACRPARRSRRSTPDGCRRRSCSSWRRWPAGRFLETATNVLAFGLPGRRQEPRAVRGGARAGRGRPQRVVRPGLCPGPGAARWRSGTSTCPRALRKLDLFEVILLDDLGYVQQSPDEAEVLFTLLAERYERRSVMVTSNLVFSQWDRIFRDQMATAAAIDRLVHHAVVLEFDVTSYRTDRSRRKSPSAQTRIPSIRRRWKIPHVFLIEYCDGLKRRGADARR